MKRNLIAAGFGLVGVVLGLGAWHVWADHQALHALINMAVQQAQARQQAPHQAEAAKP